MTSGAARTIAAIVGIGAILAPAQTPEQVARAALPSVVVVVAADARGRPLPPGSGFFVGPGMIATNLHVIAAAYTGYVHVVGHRSKRVIRDVIAVDRQNDLALLRVAHPAPAASPAPVLRLAIGDPVVIGEPVFAIGSPLGWEGTFSEGIVSAIHGRGPKRRLRITASVSPGSSGGPVLNTQGEVIGIAVGAVRDGENLSLAIPVGDLAALLRTPAADLPLAALAGDGAAAAGTPPEPRIFVRAPGGQVTVEEAFAKRCPHSRVITVERDADYIFSLEYGGPPSTGILASALWKNFRWSLARANGDLVAGGSDHLLKNAMKDACRALGPPA